MLEAADTGMLGAGGSHEFSPDALKPLARVTRSLRYPTLPGKSLELVHAFSGRLLCNLLNEVSCSLKPQSLTTLKIKASCPAGVAEAVGYLTGLSKMLKCSETPVFCGLRIVICGDN